MLIHDVPTSMDEGVRDLWVTALTSGAYEQIPYFLRRDGKFSALGILCDLAAMSKIVQWDILDGIGFFAPWDPGHTAIPYRIIKWADFKGMHPSQLVPLTYEGRREPLYELEDRDRLTLPQLAELIKEQY